MRTIKDNKLEAEIYEGKHPEWKSFDAKYGVLETIELMDKQLEEYGLEVELLEHGGSWYTWRVAERDSPVPIYGAIFPNK